MDPKVFAFKELKGRPEAYNNVWILDSRVHERISCLIDDRIRITMVCRDLCLLQPAPILFGI